jgi:hypothetical protein
LTASEKTADQLKALIVERCRDRGIAVNPRELVILNGPSDWTLGFLRSGGSVSPEQATIEEIGRKIRAEFRLSGMPG